MTSNSCGISSLYDAAAKYSRLEAQPNAETYHSFTSVSHDSRIVDPIRGK